MKKKRVAITISMPEEMAEEYEGLAKRLSRNKSALFREMFIAYKRQSMEKKFRDLQIYGTAKGREKGILTESDVEKLIFEGR